MISNLDMIRDGHVESSINGALEEVRRGAYPLSELRHAVVVGLKHKIRGELHYIGDPFTRSRFASYKQYIGLLERGEEVTLPLSLGDITIPADR